MKNHSAIKRLKNFAISLGLVLMAASGQTTGFTSIDFPGATSTTAWGVNDRGDVVGLYSLADKTNHGFLYRGGVLTSIDFPGATSTETYGINLAGDIVGDYTMNGKIHGFVLSQGRFTTTDFPGATTTELAAINPSHQILAFYILPDGSTHSALIQGEQFTNIDLPNQNATSANGINAGGDIVGAVTKSGFTTAFVLSKGQMTPITVPGASFTGAYGIDAGGNIVGRYKDAAGVSHGFIRSGGAITTIDIPGASFTGAAAINSVGDIVGRYTAGGINHAFLLSSPILNYSVTDLGTLPGGSFSQPSIVSNDGLISGVSDVPGGNQHAVLWQFGGMIDLAASNFAGVNSLAFGIGADGSVNGQVETTVMDANGEDFCAYGTHRQCKAFLWENGAMTLLPTLGGDNSTVGTMNKRGQIAGIAENGVVDRSCTAPQAVRFQPVIWGPKQGEIRALDLPGGDTVGVAMSINDRGQTVGAAGTCGNTFPPPFSDGPHAVLWESDGSVVNLGTLGGTVNPASPGQGTIALAINNPGQVVGTSALNGNLANHAFLWTSQKGMQDLGRLPGDTNSVGLGINDRSEIIGESFGAAGPINGNPRPFLWRNGIMADLNSLVTEDSPLYLLVVSAINNQGEIVGFGVTPAGDIHAFLATPQEGQPGSLTPSARPLARPVLMDHARRVLREHLGRLGVRGPEQQ
jgi:probable HAF family extracellular repeat protein